MAAAISFIPRIKHGAPGRTQTYGEDEERRERKARKSGENLYKLRLPASEANVLRWVFSDLEGRVGNGSNFGQMIAQLAAAPDAKADPWPRGTPVSEQVDRQTMYVHGGAPPGRALRDTACEGWACWSHHGPNGLATAVHVAREALLGIDTHHAVTLYRMYGADHTEVARTTLLGRESDGADEHGPKFKEKYRLVWRYEGLGDLTPLAEDSPTVRAHAEELSSEGLMLDPAPGYAYDVGPHAALADLLEVHSGDSKARRAERKAAGEVIHRECATALAAACTAYRKARDKVSPYAPPAAHWTVQDRAPGLPVAEAWGQFCDGCGRQVRFSGGGAVCCGCGI